MKAAEVSRRDALDDEDDEREERPSLVRRERDDFFERPRFRLFGGD